MARRVTHRETLIYYDGPQLYVAEDQIGTLYICLLTGQETEFDHYVCVPVSKSCLVSFKEGEIDLRGIFEHPESGEIFEAHVRNADEPVDLVPVDRENVPSDWLPDDGFRLQAATLPDDTVVKESKSSNRAIVHVSLNPPESRSEPQISAEKLSEVLAVFQNLVKYAYKKSVSLLDPVLRKGLEDPANYQLQVFAFSPGSFTLHLHSANRADLVGFVQIEKALRRVDQIAEKMSDERTIIDVLKENRGHVVTTYKRLLKFVIDSNSPVSYAWTMPELGTSISRKISLREAVTIYDLLGTREDLQKEEIVLRGHVMQADVKRHTWTLISREDSKSYRGKCKPGSDVTLSGIILETREYEFRCEERLEVERATGKEKTSLFLESLRGL